MTAIEAQQKHLTIILRKTKNGKTPEQQSEDHAATSLRFAKSVLSHQIKDKPDGDELLARIEFENKVINQLLANKTFE